jgi:hypothetical protein
MKAALLLLLIATFTGCSTNSTRVDRPVSDSLLGNYEFSSGKNRDDVVIAAAVTREAGKLAFSFQAAHPDGHGAAPDGSGTGTLGADGVFRFDYSDSFDNRGSGTFRRTAKGYALSITIQTVAEPRCMPFYGNFLLHRVAERRQ